MSILNSLFYIDKDFISMENISFEKQQIKNNQKKSKLIDFLMFFVNLINYIVEWIKKKVKQTKRGEDMPCEEMPNYKEWDLVQYKGNELADKTEEYISEFIVKLRKFVKKLNEEEEVMEKDELFKRLTGLIGGKSEKIISTSFEEISPTEMRSFLFSIRDNYLWNELLIVLNLETKRIQEKKITLEEIIEIVHNFKKIKNKRDQEAVLFINQIKAGNNPNLIIQLTLLISELRIKTITYDGNDLNIPKILEDINNLEYNQERKESFSIELKEKINKEQIIGNKPFERLMFYVKETIEKINSVKKK